MKKPPVIAVGGKYLVLTVKVLPVVIVK